MKPSQRYSWIELYLTKNNNIEVSVTDADFVDAYVRECQVKHRQRNWGAHSCPSLGRDLANMRQYSMLKRSRSSISGMAGMGFPTWVWSYRIPEYIWINRKERAKGGI